LKLQKPTTPKNYKSKRQKKLKTSERQKPQNLQEPGIKRNKSQETKCLKSKEGTYHKKLAQSHKAKKPKAIIHENM